jgi:2,4-dienoyl-CoA reductase-like NADH-dependent reductase (Old Yellow Enzyme family)
LRRFALIVKGRSIAFSVAAPSAATNRAREREFAELTEDEVARIEATYAEAFSG